MDVWNIFSIERRSAFLRFRLVDDDFDDVLSGEKRSSMVDSEDFGEEDIAQKKEQKNVVVVVVVVKAFKKQHVVVSTKHNQKGKRKRFGRQKERENIYDFLAFFRCFFFGSFFKRQKFFSRYKKFFPYIVKR